MIKRDRRTDRYPGRQTDREKERDRQADRSKRENTKRRERDRTTMNTAAGSSTCLPGNQAMRVSPLSVRTSFLHIFERLP